jgi:hypothetical protein
MQACATAEVLIFTLTSASDSCEQSASHPSCFIPGKEHCTLLIGDWIGSRVSVHTGKKINISCPAMNLILIPPHNLISRYSYSDILNFSSSQRIIILRQSKMVKFLFEHALPLIVSNVDITSVNDINRGSIPQCM